MWSWDFSRFCEELLFCYNAVFLFKKYWFLFTVTQCTVPTMQHHSTVEYPEFLSFLFILLPQDYTYSKYTALIYWSYVDVRKYFFFDGNIFNQIPHRVNVANVFFTCMRFLRIAYPNLLLEMCVHGGMLAHFST